MNSATELLEYLRHSPLDRSLSDLQGSSVEEAIANGRLALKETIAALKAAGLPVPLPTQATAASGKFVARIPKSVHAKLSSRAKAEGVSLNTLVVSLLSDGLGRKSTPA